MHKPERSANVNKVTWDLEECKPRSKGDKCKDLDPGEPPFDFFLRITGGTTKLDDLLRLLLFCVVVTTLGESEFLPPGLRLMFTPK